VIFSRSIFVTSVIIISCATSAIPTIATLFISRFILGLSCGFSMIAGGTYIRQMFS
jgi:MFS family permease